VAVPSAVAKSTVTERSLASDSDTVNVASCVPASPSVTVTSSIETLGFTRTVSGAVEVTVPSVRLRPETVSEYSWSARAPSDGVTWTVAFALAPAPSVRVSVLADQPAGRPVIVKSKLSDASPVFITGNVSAFGSPGERCGTPWSRSYGSTSTPGPRTSKYARIVAAERPMARTATADEVPSFHPGLTERWGVEKSDGSNASTELPP
jgi:hypothetical protein